MIQLLIILVDETQPIKVTSLDNEIIKPKTEVVISNNDKGTSDSIYGDEQIISVNFNDSIPYIEVPYSTDHTQKEAAGVKLSFEVKPKDPYFYGDNGDTNVGASFNYIPNIGGDEKELIFNKATVDISHKK